MCAKLISLFIAFELMPAQTESEAPKASPHIPCSIMRSNERKYQQLDVLFQNFVCESVGPQSTTYMREHASSLFLKLNLLGILASSSLMLENLL